MNLANKITIARIVAIPVYAAIFLLNKYIPYAYIISTVVFCLASFSDFLDGYIARKYNQVTDLGKFLDPIADKLLVTSALLLIIDAGIGFKPVTMILSVIIIAREFMISAFRQIAATKNIVMQADGWGKLKALFQYLALAFLLPSIDFNEIIGIDVFMYIGFSFLVISTILAIYSGLNYIIKNKKVFGK